MTKNMKATGLLNNFLNYPNRIINVFSRMLSSVIGIYVYCTINYYCQVTIVCNILLMFFSSDDEVQKMMRGIAGVSRESKKREINEFEQEMEKELTSAFEFQKSGWTYNQTGTKADEKVVVTTKEESTTNLPSTSKRKENSDDDDDEDENALRLVEKITDSDEGSNKNMIILTSIRKNTRSICRILSTRRR